MSLIDETNALSVVESRRVRALVGKPPGSLRIHEIYRSLQGEGTFAGLPCVFVRLSVCHLRCNYCDSAHAFHAGSIVDLHTVLEQAFSYGCPLVEVTGGEPLLQPEVLPLMTALCDAGATVLLETSGSLDIQPVDDRVRIILDLKTPGSGEGSANLWSNLDHLKPIDEVKFVLSDRDDFRWMVDVIERHELTRRCPILASPVHGRVDPTELAVWILESNRNIRLQLQLHKILWGPQARGV